MGGRGGRVALEQTVKGRGARGRREGSGGVAVTLWREGDKSRGWGEARWCREGASRGATSEA